VVTKTDRLLKAGLIPEMTSSDLAAFSLSRRCLSVCLFIALIACVGTQNSWFGDDVILAD